MLVVTSSATVAITLICQREGGDPERFNGNSLAAMDGTGPMGNAIVLLLLLLLLLFPRRAAAPSTGRIS